jgi:hypothetical protein
MAFAGIEMQSDHGELFVRESLLLIPLIRVHPHIVHQHF